MTKDQQKDYISMKLENIKSVFLMLLKTMLFQNTGPEEN